jgi:hypothetical protein
MLTKPASYETPILIDGEEITFSIVALTRDQRRSLREQVRDAESARRRAGQLLDKATTIEEINAALAVQKFADEKDDEGKARIVAEFVSVGPGYLQLTAPDGTTAVPVTTGAQIVEFFAARQAIINLLYLSVLNENTMSPDEKKAWRSRLVSGTGSRPETPAANGGAPAPIADAAGS